MDFLCTVDVCCSVCSVHHSAGFVLWLGATARVRLSVRESDEQRWREEEDGRTEEGRLSAVFTAVKLLNQGLDSSLDSSSPTSLNRKL